MAKRKIVKQKKINEYASLILVIVIAFAAMGIIPILLDENAKVIYAEISETLDAEYKVLVENIEALVKSHEDLKNNIEKLEGVGVENKDWEGASEKIAEKLEEIEKFEAEYFEAFANTDLGLTYLDYFNYVKDSKEGKLASEYFALLKNNAKLEASRAPSLEKLNKTVEEYKEDVKAILTNIQVLENILADIGKIELKDLDNYNLLKSHFATINPLVYTADENKTLETKITKEMNDTFREVALNDFIAKAKLLPENPYKLYKTTDVDTAQMALNRLTDVKYSLFTAQELNDLDSSTDYKKLHAIFDASVIRAAEIKEMKGAKTKPGTAAYINEQLKGKDKAKIDDKNVKKTLDDIHNIEDMIAQWEIQYGVITDKADPNYCDEIYNLIDRDILRTYIANYNKFIKSK